MFFNVRDSERFGFAGRGVGNANPQCELVSIADVPCRELAAACVAGTLPANGAPTKVLLFFDTEDYTCDRSNDPIRDIADILTSEGVLGNFDIVCEKATLKLDSTGFNVEMIPFSRLPDLVLPDQALAEKSVAELKEICGMAG